MGGLFIALVGVLASGQGPELDVEVRAHERGVAIVEVWALAEERGDFVRTMFLQGVPGRWPLKQRIEGLEVTSGSGAPLPAEVVAYGRDRLRLVVSDPPQQLRFSYQLIGVRGAESGRGQFAMELYEEPRPAMVTIHSGNGTTVDAHAYDADFEGNVLVKDEGGVWRGGPLATNSGVTITVDGVASNMALRGEIVEQLGLPLAALVGLLLVSLLLIGAPGSWRAAGILLGIGVTSGLAGWYFVSLARFDASAPQYSGLERTVSGVSASLVYVGIVGALGFVTFTWLRLLRAARGEAWHTAFGLPVFFALLIWPAAEVQPALWLVPFASAVPLLAWVPRRARTWAGADLDQLVEVVRSDGAIDLETLGRRCGLSRRRLDVLLRAHPDLGIITDWTERRAFSPASAALKAHAVCPGCGGATRLTQGSGLAQCGHCTRSFANIAPLKPTRPVPAVVRALSALLMATATTIAIWTGLLAVVALADEWLKEGMSAALGYAAILGVVGLGLYGAVRSGAEAIVAGRGYHRLRVALLLGAPFVAPLFALRALSTRRAQLHFGRFEPAALQARLDEQKELAATHLAEWLQCTTEEAAALCVFLVGNDQLNAIYDRSGARLVTRLAYAQLAADVSCRSCGGLKSEVAGEVRCTWCGVAA